MFSWSVYTKYMFCAFPTTTLIGAEVVVNDQVRDALLQGSKILHTNLWWIVAQTGWRIAFGLSLWLGYVCWLHGWLGGLLGAE